MSAHLAAKTASIALRKTLANIALKDTATLVTFLNAGLTLLDIRKITLKEFSTAVIQAAGGVMGRSKIAAPNARLECLTMPCKKRALLA